MAYNKPTIPAGTRYFLTSFAMFAFSLLSTLSSEL